MSVVPIQKIKTISQYHELRGLPKPEHPLISVVKFEEMSTMEDEVSRWSMDFYSIALKRNFGTKIKYGQQDYDFDEGILFFIAPGQVFSVERDMNNPLKPSGWMLLIHPDFLWGTALAKTIQRYEYFEYAVHEALFLSPKEEATLIMVLQNIAMEYHSNIDKFSSDVIVAQLELFFTYADRFYNRQFITRKIINHHTIDKLEAYLNQYFTSDQIAENGIPTVVSVAENLHISPNYLSRLLQTLTGKSTKQFIQEKLIDVAKVKLSNTDLTVAEIAFELGFEHPQSFSKLFKAKTNFSPLAFRQSFN